MTDYQGKGGVRISLPSCQISPFTASAQLLGVS